MKITNIDASEKFVEQAASVLDFILDVVSSLNSEATRLNHLQVICPYHGEVPPTLPLSPVRKFKEKGYENIVYLLHTIPIYLRKSCPESRKEEDIVDSLGAYFPNIKNDNPYIELYETIETDSNGGKEHFKWLFTKVLIHELAHAALDIFNHEYPYPQTEKVHYYTKFGKWREESMANAVALKIIKGYGDKLFYNYAKKFMLSQPAEYALGVLMEDFGYWDFRSVMDGKRDGVSLGFQQEWLKYAMSSPTWDGLKKWNDVLCSRPDDNGLIKVQDISTLKFGMVDADYKAHIPFDYDSISITSSKMYLVTKNNQYAIVDSTNKPIVPFGQYDRIDEERRGHRWVKKGNEFALVDSNFNIVIPFNPYDDVDKYVDGHAKIKKAGKWGIIDKHGTIVVQCKYDKICLYNGGAAILSIGNTETEMTL